MRNRFFFIILSTLILGALGVNLVHVYFFKTQRLILIDKQISEVSKVLQSSSEFNEAIQNPKILNEVISRVLKGVRIGKVFILRDKQSQIIFQSINADLLNVPLPTTPEWVVTETETEYVRIHNIPWPGTDRQTLQVGLVVDRNFINWEIVDRRLVAYTVGLIVVLFLISILLTLLLLSPLRQLVHHLKGATANLSNLRDVEPLPNRLTRFGDDFWARSDEFSELISTVRKLIDRINLNYRLTRSWTMQMAHELKTPLAIIRADMESGQKTSGIPNSLAQSVTSEINNMSNIITRFLEWAELESSQSPNLLHAFRIGNAVKAICTRLDKIGPGRIHFKMDSDFQIFCHPQHFDQMVTNLITNALKFSPSTDSVEVVVSNHSLSVMDRGPGIPEDVKERIGQPFNVGAGKIGKGNTGHGLGLAWVSTVAKLYSWNLEVESHDGGTVITVRFSQRADLMEA